jgi:phosphatidylinositol phospholipase C gamma-1
VITNVQKQGGGWWKGDHGENKQKWFPRDFVEEIEVLDSPFGTLQTGSVDLGKVEIVKNTSSDSTECPYILNIYGSPIPFRVGVGSEKEAEEWERAINHAVNHKKARVSSMSRLLILRDITRFLTSGRRAANPDFLSQSEQRQKSEKKNKIAKELSQIIIYACSVPKVVPAEVRQNGRVFQAMSSFDENKGDKLMTSEPAFFVWLHQVSAYLPVLLL